MESNTAVMLDRERVAQNIQSLAGKEPGVAPLLAARGGLRAFPLLGLGNDFDYWPTAQRSHHLLTCAAALLLAWSGESVSESLMQELGKIGAASRRFIAGAEGSPLQGETLQWANLVGLAAQCANIANDSDPVKAGARAAEALETAMHFLTGLAQAPGDLIVQEDINAVASAGVASARQFPLWLNVSTGEHYQSLIANFFANLEHLIRFEQSSDSRVASLLQQLRQLIEQMLDGKILQEIVKPFVAETLDYLSAEKKVEPERPAGAATAASTAAPLETGAAEDIEQALKEELAYRPSDRQSVEQISQVDQLNRGRLVDALATILAADGNDSHQTIGLLGDWGVGKSTLVHLLKNELIQRRAQQPFLFAEFNAWAYEHTDNLQAGIAQEMLKALTSDLPRPADQGALARAWYGLRWTLERGLLTCRFVAALNGGKLVWLLLMLLLSVLPFTWSEMGAGLQSMFADLGGETGGAVMSMMGAGLWVGGFLYYFFTRIKAVLANPLAKELLTYLKLPNYGEHLGIIPVMRKNIETLCRVRLAASRKSAKAPRLVFVVDDLDRCGHQGIVKVFEAVRLVLDLPRVTVIIAVDQRIALAALALHYKDLAEHHQLQNARAIARDYLAKVIHLPIVLSPPDEDSIDRYLNFIWREQTGELAGINATEDVVAAKAKVDETVEPASSEVELIQDSATPPLESETTTNAAGASNVVAFPAAQVGNVAAPANVKQQAAPVRIVAGLSDGQKKAFQFWVKHFGLANPRQLKRLHNSYNLLRHFYHEDQRIDVLADTAAKGNDFPLMVTLFALEYLNGIDDLPLRSVLKQRLRSGSTGIVRDGEVPVSGPLDTAVVRLVNRKMPASSKTLVDAVEPFVLPAIEYPIVPVPPAEKSAPG